MILFCFKIIDSLNPPKNQHTDKVISFSTEQKDKYKKKSLSNSKYLKKESFNYRMEEIYI